MRLYFIGLGQILNVEIKVLLMSGYPIAAPEWHRILSKDRVQSPLFE
jgi:hypothetical protein